MQRQHCKFSALRGLSVQMSGQASLAKFFSQENRSERIFPGHLNMCLQPKEADTHPADLDEVPQYAATFHFLTFTPWESKLC